jgi:zinc transporter 1/2/3
MDLLTFKALAFALVGATGLAAGFAPLRMGGSSGSERFFALANALAGGVFLGAALIHMLPDGMEALEGRVAAYPVASALAAGGFLLILFLERVLLRGQENDAVVGSMGRPAIFPYVLLLVLSVHSLIAGAALGLETTVGASVAILVAIVAHKGSAAFALGVSMAQGAVDPGRARRLMALFASTTPLGILVGALVGRALADDTALLVEGCIDGVAAGTFLYVAVLDIIEEEFSQPADRVVKFALLFVGLGLMAAVAVWT